MAPKLRVLVSTSQAYPPTTEYAVNSLTPTPIKTPLFEGDVSVWIKGFTGDKKGGDGDEYFEKRRNMTYGIAVRGRFLEEVDTDEVVFGNVFERSIKDNLPWGTAVALKFINYVEPTIEVDLYSDKPFALSPALASMNFIYLSRDTPVVGQGHGMVEENSLAEIHKLYTGGEPPPEVSGETKTDRVSRRKWMNTKEHRTGVKLSKDLNVGMEFCNGFLDFNTLSLTFPPPFHLSVPLLRYWDGQPVTYVCRKRSTDPGSEDGVFWSVRFEIVDEDAIKELERKRKASGRGDEIVPIQAEEKAEGAAQSYDVD